MDQQRPAEHRRVAAEIAAPERVRDHRHARRARPVVLGQQRPPHGRGDAEDLEVIAGDDLAQRHARPVAGLDRRNRRAVAEHAGEDGVPRAEVEEVGIGVGGVGVAVAALGVDVHQAVGAFDRQRPEEQRINDGEEGRIEADTDPQREDGDRREPGRAEQPLQRIADVGKHVVGHTANVGRLFGFGQRVNFEWRMPNAENASGECRRRGNAETGVSLACGCEALPSRGGSVEPSCLASSSRCGWRPVSKPHAVGVAPEAATSKASRMNRPYDIQDRSILWRRRSVDCLQAGFEMPPGAIVRELARQLLRSGTSSAQTWKKPTPARADRTVRVEESAISRKEARDPATGYVCSCMPTRVYNAAAVPLIDEARQLIRDSDDDQVELRVDREPSSEPFGIRHSAIFRHSAFAIRH